MADVNFLFRCLQLMLDAIFSCCDGVSTSDVSSRCFSDGHCMRLLDPLYVSSARHRALKTLGSEGASLSSSRCHDDA